MAKGKFGHIQRNNCIELTRLKLDGLKDEFNHFFGLSAAVDRHDVIVIPEPCDKPILVAQNGLAASIAIRGGNTAKN